MTFSGVMHQPIVLHQGTLLSQPNSVTTTQIDGSMIHLAAGSGYGARSELHFLLSGTKYEILKMLTVRVKHCFLFLYFKMQCLFTHKNKKKNQSIFLKKFLDFPRKYTLFQDFQGLEMKMQNSMTFQLVHDP